MALFELNFYSATLGLSTACNVILPQKMPGTGEESTPSTPKKYPVLYLLHGASDDYTFWLRRTSIERYVAERELAVVMPDALISMYENETYGAKYQDFITEELPRVVESFFPISGKREDKSIAGLSMGGSGALKIGLQYPEKYASVGVFSAGNVFHSQTDISALNSRRQSGGVSRMQTVYGVTDWTALKGTDWDPFVLGERNLAAGKPMPRFFHVCGTEDFMLDCARTTRDWFVEHPAISYEYHEGPGIHNWAFWDEWIQEYLKFMERSELR